MIITIIISICCYIITLKMLNIITWKLCLNDYNSWEHDWPNTKEKYVNGLISGPRLNYITRLISSFAWTLSHYPSYILRIITMSIQYIPNMIYVTLKKDIKYIIDDEVYYNILTDTSLLLISDINDDKLYLNAPDDLPGQLNGYSAAGISVVLDLNTKKIVLAKYKNGKDIEKYMLLYLLSSIMIYYTHSFSHYAAEKNVREIISNNVSTLFKSARYTLALHDGLLHSKYSPFSISNIWPFSLPGSTVPMAEYLYKYKAIIPHKLKNKNFMYIKYCLEARKIVIEQVKKYKLKINPEYLFINMIVHSLDHSRHYKHIQNLSLYPWINENSFSFRSLMAGLSFFQLWVPTIDTLFDSEKLKYSNEPFYKEIYTKLKNINQEYADTAVYSTSC